ncbi:tRNA (adenosine(37)-N6)-threonylcarbamoyltransferase complex ATPase subunit type 1 TsaE [Nesterenkonia lutea]|uniref:tRNA threonylcarbamoyladenosine biosynthesis protein TsaE n=1 Tax=Nesterenkonia lutea TaxID=272919 RepID=A0ABR9JB04_9MICC|nr:tRNA (adenosine(37)-N6)-threonylcarbamoyltransferase complex ATPase subunit type 1 TsaE [Nesterenkonia lutea]MBE1523098.1 tRNA threonylcarbamoyladenosine biosynthesis protein TsaE [Nesterenkonia lutea]
MSALQDPDGPPPGERWRIEVVLEDLQATAAFAGDLAVLLGRGDLLVLTGGLGAGKTTLTQSLGEALDVTGRISSPTFIMSRVHRARDAGPDLVHVDAYRTDSAGLESLDLSSTMAEAVTVVEWGRGMVENTLVGPGGSWLDLELIREDLPVKPSAPAAPEIITDFSESEADVLGSRRRAVLRGYGPAWADPPAL